jgi:hypothetical protein
VDGGPVPEDLALVLASEACESQRPIECATFLARGLHDHPGSERLRRLAEVQAAEGTPLDGAQLALLRALYGDAGAAPAGGAQAAEALTATYLQYFQHALPFDSSAVTRAWRHCTVPADVCRDGAERAARRLGLPAGTL